MTFRALTERSADGDVKLTESHVVSEYLDNAYPNAGSKLFPSDPHKLAKVQAQAKGSEIPICFQCSV